MVEANESYNNSIELLKAKFNSFLMEVESGKTNKSSALRARKISMELRSDLKDFRTTSTANDRLHTKTRGT